MKVFSVDITIYMENKNTMDIVTADGGFDFSLDFNQQENMATQLIFCEVFYALAVQKQGGSFILKIFDVFHKTTVDILYICVTRKRTFGSFFYSGLLFRYSG